MKKSLFLLLPALALFGQGCEIPASPGPVAKETPVIETKPAEKLVCPVPVPQVHFLARGTFSASEVRQINRDIVDPIKAYYDTSNAQGHVVSIMVRKQGTDLIIDSIIDQPGTDEPVYEGVLLSRLKDGTYERWSPPDPGPGYEG